MSRLRSGSCAVLVTAVLLAGCTSKDAVDTSSRGRYRFVSATSVGSFIPISNRKPVGPVTGTLITGGNFALASTAGQVVIVNFFASWCGPCQTETPQFAALYRQLHSSGVDFVGVDTKETSRDDATTFITDNDVNYPVVWDEPGRTAIELGHIPALGLPFTVLVDKRGRVAAVYLTKLAPADLRPVISTLLAEAT